MWTYLQKIRYSMQTRAGHIWKSKELGFKLRIHADEIEAIGGSVLAGQMKAVSAGHLIKIDEAGLGSLSEGGVTAMCLPPTSFYLGADFARSGG